MKNNLFLICVLLFSTISAVAQSKKAEAFQSGEYLEFKISYGFVNAGIATLTLGETTYKGKSLYHAKGIGYTTGMTKVFFKVYDDYQSYFEKGEVIPHRFIRKIDEGGYTKDQDGTFNYDKKSVTVKDNEKKVEKTYPIVKDVQDIVSAFYYLRKTDQIDNIKAGESVEIDMFFDGEVFKFKLKYLGTEVLKTNIGKVKTMKFRPYVMAGRVFKEKESLTVWVTADSNKVPVRVKASLAVGSLKADLDKYKGLVTNLQFEK
ncbi:MAG: DUF3108 domain-containing protein [Flavobacteriaceae bacterium]|nr:DUF3108 domain-containing protein [Flavobacteriaceae bacterium]